MKRIVVAVLLLAVALGCVKNAPETVPSGMSPEEAKTIVRQGVALHDQGKYDEAIQIFQDLLKRDPGNEMAVYEMAYSYWAKGDREKALESVDRGLKVADDPADLYEMKGNCLDELGRRAEALKVYRKALKTTGHPYLVYYNMGLTLLRMEKFDEAEDAIKHAAVLNPGHPTSQVMLGRLWARKGMQVQSIFAYMRFLILEPKSPRSLTAAEELRQVLNLGVTRTEDGANINLDLSALFGKDDAYKNLKMLLSMSAALVVSESEKAGNTPMERVRGQFDSLFGSMAERRAEADDFAWKYYSEYYRKAADYKLVDAMAAIALESLFPDECRTWQAEHPVEVRTFHDWDDAFTFPGEEIL